MPSEPPSPSLVDRLFRRCAVEMVARLARSFGPEHLDLAEDVVQDALLKALRTWPTQGTPDDPEAWLARVARNGALDALRRRGVALDKQAELETWYAGAASPAGPLDEEIRDDQLRLIFTCCHPALGRDARVALTLKLLGGFSVAEVAHAFLTTESTMAQRLVRAKSALRGTGTTLTIPEGPELDERLHSVLDVLYLLFNEGYAAHSGPSVVRHDVAREALRLGNLVVRSAPFAVPKTHALLALMHFQTSRLAARQASDGTPLSLEEQDRGLWDRAHVRSGFAHLERASRGDTLTAYHLEAGIASCHASAPSFAATDWQRILSLYDQLATRAPSPIVDLNRAVALAAVHGPAAALTELDRLRADPLLARYHLLHATCAEMHRRLGDFEAATDELQRALALATSEPDRRLLERRLRERRANDLPPPQS